MWKELFKRYWRVSTFQDTPANTPYSPFLLSIAAGLFFLLIVLQWRIADINQQVNFGVAILAGLSLLTSYFLYTYALLKFCQKVNRFLQTLTCLLLSHFIIHVFVLPLLLLAPILVEANFSQIAALILGTSYLVLTLALTAWQFLIAAYVYKHALEVDYLASVLASFGLLAMNILLVSFW